MHDTIKYNHFLWPESNYSWHCLRFLSAHTGTDWSRNPNVPLSTGTGADSKFLLPSTERVRCGYSKGWLLPRDRKAYHKLCSGAGVLPPEAHPRSTQVRRTGQGRPRAGGQFQPRVQILKQVLQDKAQGWGQARKSVLRLGSRSRGPMDRQGYAWDRELQPSNIAHSDRDWRLQDELKSGSWCYKQGWRLKPQVRLLRAVKA